MTTNLSQSDADHVERHNRYDRFAVRIVGYISSTFGQDAKEPVDAHAGAGIKLYQRSIFHCSTFCWRTLSNRGTDTKDV